MHDPEPIFSVSVVIVSFNTRDKLRHCLSRLDAGLEVIVVDNDSRDGSAEMVAAEFPGVVLIRNRSNVGFGPANNQGAACATGRFIFYLNSDAYARPGAIALLALALDHPGVSAVGPKLLNLDGTLQNSSANRLTLWAVFCEQTYLEKLAPGTKLFSPYWNTAQLLKRGGNQITDQVMGAALMCRAGLASFDERFFLYCEDTDLCVRLAAKGKILYVPAAEIEHELGSSSSASRWLAVARYNHGKELYFRIHHGLPAMGACLFLDRLGALLRLCTWSLASLATLFMVPRFRSQVVLFARVLAARP